MRYRLYIDESGDHGYGTMDDIGTRFLGITGLAIDTETYRTKFQPDLERLKQTFFPHNPDDPVILHRREIVYCQGPFKSLQDAMTRKVFDDAFINFVSQQQYLVSTVVLDKKAHVDRHGAAAYHPYHYCLAVLLERYCGYLNYFGHTGDVMAEARGGEEDRQLKKEYSRLLNEGTFFRATGFFRGVLTSKHLKLKPKSANIAGLQVADLLVHPSKQDVLVESGLIPFPAGDFREKLHLAMTSHYNRQVWSNQIRGYGRVLL